MITRFFSTSRPAHLIIISAFVFVLFFVVRAESVFEEFQLLKLIRALLTVLILIFSISLLAFFVTKNNLTKRNSYKIMFFALFFAVLPQTLLNDNIIVANLFVLLALRRIISLRTNKNLIKKLFDAGFWIAIASLFYFWAFLFFGLILSALFLFTIANTRNLILPFLGLLTVVVLVVCYSIIVNDTFGNVIVFVDGISYDFSAYNHLKFIIPITVLTSLGIWSSFFYLKTFKDKPKNYRAAHFLVLLCTLIAVMIVVVSPLKTGSEFMFLFAPLAIIMSNYIQIAQEKWFAEVFVWMLIITPITLLFL